MTPIFPAHWETVTVGDLADVSGGLTKNASKRDASTVRAPLVSVAAVRLRQIDETAIGEVGILTSDGDRGSLKPGDLLIVEGNGSLEHIGRVALWDRDVPGARHQNHIIRVRPHEVSSRFLLEWLASPRGRDSIVDTATSATGLYTLSLSKVERLPAPLPPLNEQRRIVAKLDAIFEQTRAAKARLERLPVLLEKLNGSILAAAFRGDLTADWRAAHPDVDPASALLDRIRTERRRRWEAYLRAKGKDPFKARYEEPEPADDGDLGTLPDGWQWSTLASLAWDSSYGTSAKCNYDAEGECVLRIPNVLGGEIDMKDRKHAVIPLALDSHDLLDRGDFLIVRTNGSRDLIGRASCLVDEKAVGCYFASYLIRFRIVDAALGRWLSLWWRSPFMRRWLEQRAATSAGQYNISLSTLATAPVPMTSLDEQSHLTEIVEQALMVTKSHASSFERTTRTFVRAEQAALAKAFRGELVPQDPKDEPAAVLLDRIRAARGRAPESPGRRPHPADAPTGSRKSNGHSTTADSEGSLDLVVAALQQGEPRLTAADIADATNLDAPAVMQVLETLVATGQVRIHGKARGTAYEWVG